MARPKPNTGVHIVEVLERTACERHKVPKGIPCFLIYYDTRENYGPAVCGGRVVKAGFNGTINPSSLSKSSKRQATRNRS
jgi:hypothetical protein